MGASRAEAALYVLFLLILFVRDAFHPSALQFLLHPFVASLHLLPQRISLFLRQEKRQRHVLLLPVSYVHFFTLYAATADRSMMSLWIVGASRRALRRAR